MIIKQFHGNHKHDGYTIATLHDDDGRRWWQVHSSRYTEPTKYPDGPDTEGDILRDIEDAQPCQYPPDSVPH